MMPYCSLCTYYIAILQVQVCIQQPKHNNQPQQENDMKEDELITFTISLGL